MPLSPHIQATRATQTTCDSHDMSHTDTGWLTVVLEKSSWLVQVSATAKADLLLQVDDQRERLLI
jgi:hypothetical protein